MNEQQTQTRSWLSKLALNERAQFREGEADFDIGELLDAVRRNALWLAAWICICIGCGAIYLVAAVPEYVASTQVILEPLRPPSATLDAAAAIYESSLDSAQADSQIQVVKSEHTLRFVFDSLHLNRDPMFTKVRQGAISRILSLFRLRPHSGTSSAAEGSDTRAFEDFAGRIAVNRIGQSYVLSIAFRAPNAKRAAQLANAVTASYIRSNILFNYSLARRSADLLKSRLGEIQSELTTAAEAVRSGVLPDAPFPDSDTQIVSAALPPLGKSSPNTKLVFAFSIFMGALTGLGLVMLRAKLDRKIRNCRQIIRALDFRCSVQAAPRIRTGPNSRHATRDPETTSQAADRDLLFSDSMRSLRTAVLTNRSASQHICVGIASWSSGEGRSTIANGLALQIASSQERATLIDADFRRPSLSRLLAPKSAFGLDQALSVPAGLMRALPLPIAPGLDFIPAVAEGQPGDLNVFVGSPLMAKLLQSLQEKREVIIDLPPMCTSADTLAIGNFLDGVVLVVEAGRTTIDDLQEALMTLKSLRAPILRILLNKASSPCSIHS